MVFVRASRARGRRDVFKRWREETRERVGSGFIRLLRKGKKTSHLPVPPSAIVG